MLVRSKKIDPLLINPSTYDDLVDVNVRGKWMEGIFQFGHKFGKFSLGLEEA